MKETIELRLKPELKVIFKTEGFELIDASAPKNSGFYLYKNLNDVKLNAAGRNWIVSAVSLIVDLFILNEVSGTGNEKNKANLELKMATKNIKIWLIEADFQKAEKVLNILNHKKNHK
jgi:hypothetical protein